MQKNEIYTLNKLNVGQTALVLDIDVQDRALRRRILDMGITKGIIVKIEHIAPLGDPVTVKVRGYDLAIRKEYLSHIYCKVLTKEQERQI